MNIFNIFKLEAKFKTDTTPKYVYWLNHPTYPNQKWWMEFHKDTMMYGETFKLTLEYFRNNLLEFEEARDIKDSWKALNINY